MAGGGTVRRYPLMNEFRSFGDAYLILCFRRDWYLDGTGCDPLPPAQ